jgi:hypothetical protein
MVSDLTVILQGGMLVCWCQTNKLFSVINCRELSLDEIVLVQDYEIDCNVEKHQYVQTISVTMICVFSFGVPLGLLLLLRFDKLKKTEQFKTPAWEVNTQTTSILVGTSLLAVLQAACIETHSYERI